MMRITVYGIDAICPSCVGAPSSKETYEWLQAALQRKYNDGPSFQFHYIDFLTPPVEEPSHSICIQLQEDMLFYPLITVNDEIVGEGIPTLKPIYSFIDTLLKKSEKE